jgi:hypothetical protein
MTGSLTWAEQNLLVLLDPLNTIPVERWHFIRKSTDQFKFSNDLLLFTFSRNRVLHYLLISMFFRCCGRGKELFKVLKFQDGMTSTLFRAGNDSAYRAFVKSHATGRKTFRERIKSMLPSFINAELRYLAVGQELLQLKGEKAFDDLTFMFYSNESGKLILSAPNTLIAGRGHLVVTTANRDYHTVLNKEFKMMEQIGKIKSDLVPNLYNKIFVNGRLLFEEEYIFGTTLRETLRNKQVVTDNVLIVDYIDLLDTWFTEYRNLFSGNKVMLSELYQAPLEIFASFHSSNARLKRFIIAIRRCLAEIDMNHPGLVPIIAHNDLWPANFIVSERKLIVIDWERATFARSELFDYFFMMISAFIEYDIGKSQREDYSISFRSFLEGGDFISTLVQERLCVKLEYNGFDRKDYDLFMALFILEWSMQGYQALGCQSRMNKLVFEELLHYLEIMGDRFDSREAALLEP